MEVRVLEWKKGLEMFSLSKKGSYSAHSSEKLGLKMLIPSKNSVYFQHISASKFGTSIGIMPPPLLSSQIIHFERLHTQFGRNLEFLAILSE